MQMILLIYFNLLGFMLLPKLLSWKIKSAALPLLNLAGISLVLYIFSFFKLAAWGVVLIRNLNRLALVLCLLCIILQLCGKMRKLNNEELCSLFVYLMIYSLLFFALGLCSKGWFYTEWDEFANWDSVVRSLLLFGEKAPSIVHSAYPPGISLIPYFFSAITEHNEHIMIFAMAAVTLAALSYVVSFFSSQRLAFYFIFPLTSILLLYIFGFKLNTIMSDGLIGIIFGALLVDTCYRTDMTVGGWNQAVLLSWFVLMKDACSAFLLVVWGVLLLSQFLRKGLPIISFLKSSWRELLPTFLLPSLFLLSWKIRCGYLGISSTSGFSKISLSGLVEIILQAGTDPDNSTFKGIISFILHEPFAYAGVSTSLLILVALTLALVYCICEESKKQCVIQIFVFLGCFAYLISVILVYLFSLGNYYAHNYIGFQRFMLSYVLAWAMLIMAGILKDALKKEQPGEKSTRILALLSVMLIFSRVPLEFKFVMPGHQDPTWAKVLEFCDSWEGKIENGSRIKVIFQNTDLAEFFMLSNRLMGKAIMIGGHMTYGRIEDHPYYSQPGLEKGIADISVEELRQELVEIDADYVLIGSSDDIFWRDFGELFLNNDNQGYDSYQFFKKDLAGNYFRLDDAVLTH